MKISKAEFITSAVRADQYPFSEMPEIAFAGRSNVGKSSLINTLVNRKSLVKVSGKPGRTQTINFFNVNDEIMLVDLPGYGYAKVSKRERETWGPMIETYLAERPMLRGLVCIMDLRRGVDDDDMMLIEAAPHFGVQPILVFTKADKLGKSARNARLFEIADELGASPDNLVVFSAKDGFGRDELWNRIFELAGLDRP